MRQTGVQQPDHNIARLQRLGKAVSRHR
jgi:hypothetical protein